MGRIDGLVHERHNSIANALELVFLALTYQYKDCQVAISYSDDDEVVQNVQGLAVSSGFLDIYIFFIWLESTGSVMWVDGLCDCWDWWPSLLKNTCVTKPQWVKWCMNDIVMEIQDIEIMKSLYIYMCISDFWIE